MASTVNGSDGPHPPVAQLPSMRGSGLGPDWVADLIRTVNASHTALADLWSRIRRAADAARRSRDVARRATETAQQASLGHQLIQAEQPGRTAPLPRQLALALVTVLLDGVACYFAAQALDGDQRDTLIWTVLFLAVLGFGEWSLDHCHDVRFWRWIVAGLSLFVILLGALRLSYLVLTEPGGPVPALAGAAIFTIATAAFLVLGYRALRAAETSQAWRARRQARAAIRRQLAACAKADADTDLCERLAANYLAEVRHWLLGSLPATQHAEAEAVLWAHLKGEE